MLQVGDGAAEGTEGRAGCRLAVDVTVCSVSRGAGLLMGCLWSLLPSVAPGNRVCSVISAFRQRGPPEHRSNDARR